MKLSKVVAKHGFSPSDLGKIKNAKLYQRQNDDGVLELLCVQKIGNVMKVDRIALASMMGMLLPMSEPMNQIIPKENVEDYLNKTLRASSCLGQSANCHKTCLQEDQNDL